jgi:hypothetical protein
MTDRKPNFAEYYRQGAACLALAQLTDISSIKVRWLRMARTWFTLAEKTIEAPIPETPVTDAVPNVVELYPIRRGSPS